MDPKNKIRTWLPLWLALAIVLGIFIGNNFSIFNYKVGKINGSNKFDAVMTYIKEAYVDTVNMPELLEDALPKIVKGLDPHSMYINAADMKQVHEDLEGHFSGIGVEFYVLNDTIIVTRTIADGPSDAAGILAGDRIVQVDDSVIAGKSITNQQVLDCLRGEKGSEITLGILRHPAKKLKDIIVTRDDIPMNSVDVAYMLTDNIGIIKINKFAFTTFSEFISAISKLKNSGAGAFIIDLRGNSGGSMEAAISMVNEFLSKGDLIVYAEGRSFPRMDNYADGTGTTRNDGVVVLMDELSASASEIFAGAIQDNDRGLIIGRRSFGKGLVQSQREFRDGSAMRLTVARYYTPSGRSIQRKYEKGKNEEYEMEAINRYIQGGYVNSDTLSKNNLIPYKTISGRTVYGGEGIEPDIFVARDTVGINSYYNTLLNRDLVREFAMHYTDKKRKRLEKIKTAKELQQYLHRQPMLMHLVNYAYAKGVLRRPLLIRDSKKLLESQLEALIIRNFFGENGFYPIYLENDKVIKTAVDILQSGKAYPNAVATKRYEKHLKTAAKLFPTTFRSHLLRANINKPLLNSFFTQIKLTYYA